MPVSFLSDGDGLSPFHITGQSPQDAAFVEKLANNLLYIGEPGVPEFFLQSTSICRRHKRKLYLILLILTSRVNPE
jgi:hypothetical protein